jgi:hypothetical protein
MVVPALAGRPPMTLSWLWHQHNEHRIPLVRLLLYATTRLSRGDFRGPPLLNAALLALCAALTLRTLRSWRGHSALIDAAAPLLLLQLASSALTWGQELQFVSATALTLGVVFYRSGICLVLLPLCGGNGVVLAVPLACWLAVSGWRSQPRRSMAFSIATLALVGFYLVGWHPAANHDWPAPSLLQSLMTAMRYAASFFYPPFLDDLPLGGCLIVAWAAFASVLLATRYRRAPEERARVSTLAAFLFAELLLALVVGRGRGGRGWEPGLEYHYASAAAGLGVALLLVTALYTPAPSRRLVYGAVLAGTGLMYASHLHDAFRARDRREEDEVTAELRAGVPGATIVERHIRVLNYVDDARGREVIGRELDDLRAGGFSIGR